MFAPTSPQVDEIAVRTIVNPTRYCYTCGLPRLFCKGPSAHPKNRNKDLTYFQNLLVPMSHAGILLLIEVGTVIGEERNRALYKVAKLRGIWKPTIGASLKKSSSQRVLAKKTFRSLAKLEKPVLSALHVELPKSMLIAFRAYCKREKLTHKEATMMALHSLMEFADTTTENKQ